MMGFGGKTPMQSKADQSRGNRSNFSRSAMLRGMMPMQAGQGAPPPPPPPAPDYSRLGQDPVVPPSPLVPLGGPLPEGPIGAGPMPGGIVGGVPLPPMPMPDGMGPRPGNHWPMPILPLAPQGGKPLDPKGWY